MRTLPQSFPQSVLPHAPWNREWYLLSYGAWKRVHAVRI